MSFLHPSVSIAPSPTAEFVPGLAALAGRYDLAFCDVWGVLHDGLTAFPEAADALRRFRAGGARVVLVSNAPRPGRFVGEQLDSFGVPREAYDAIVTSGDVTRAIIADRPGEALFHLGPKRDLGLFEGLDARLGSLDEAEYVVCTGLFEDETETVADYGPMLKTMRDRELFLVCANPDIVVERGDRLILCAGAIAAAYDSLGGRTLTGGKPHRPIYEAALRVGSDALGSPPSLSRVLAIGDAIRTDIAGARDFGIDALLIARGIHAADLGYRDGLFELAAGHAWLTDQSHQPTAVAAALIWG